LYKAGEPSLKKPLFDIVKESQKHKSVQKASANAATLLAAANIPFSGQDLSKVRINGADLDSAIFDHTSFRGADLSNVNFSRCFLRECDLTRAKMGDVSFGERPLLNVGEWVHSLSYSPNGYYLAASAGNDVKIFCNNDGIYKEVTDLKGHTDHVTSVAFSLDGKFIVSGSGAISNEKDSDADNTVRLWDVESSFEGACRSC